MPVIHKPFEIVRMDGVCPGGAPCLLRREACEVQPALIEELCVPARGRRPRHTRDGLDDFAQLSFSVLQSIILELQFHARGLRLPKIEAVGDRICDYTANQSQKANVLTAVGG